MSVAQVKSEERLRAESTARILGRIILGIAVGMLLGWGWLFIVAGICSFLESVYLFSVVMRTQMLKAEMENQGRELSRREQIGVLGQAQGYALSFAVIQFVISFAVLAAIAVTTKLIASFL